MGLPQPTPTLTEQEQALQEEHVRQQDIRAVKNALYRYKDEPPVPENESLDLVQWWDVSGLTYAGSFADSERFITEIGT